MDVPDVHYARSGDVAIAYQIVGAGPHDVVLVPSYGNLLLFWQQPRFVEFFTRISSFARLILLDKRGTGLSDRPREFATLETRMDDVRAVMDAVGSERALLIGSQDGSQVTAVFAATYPERTSALVLLNPAARYVSQPDYPWGVSESEWRQLVASVRDKWGQKEFLESFMRSTDPSLSEDSSFREWWVANLRQTWSPAAAAVFYRMMGEADIRGVLPAIRVPVLVLCRADSVGAARDVADRIGHARLLEFPGTGMFIGLGIELADAVERFLDGLVEEREHETVLSTVVFTDIVGSTTLAARLGDAQWRVLLERHHALVRAQLARSRGHEVDTTGDGFFLTFDGPARGIRAATSIRDAVRELGVEIRAGLHTGECEVVSEKVAGIAVHIGQRVQASAAAGEVVVSQTVKDLVAGSGIEFEERGEHELKGVPGTWRLYAVVDG